MKISTLEIEGFKRFRKKQTLNTEGRMIAILGPNEAGKSSLLKALLSLKTPTAFVTSGPFQETTRGADLIKDKPLLTSKFRIEQSDRDALKNIPGAKSLRWFIVEKFFNGKIITTTIPKITRDIAKREQLLDKIRHLYSTMEDAKDDAVSSAVVAAMPTLLDEFEKALTAKELPPELSNQLKSLTGALGVYKDPERMSLQKDVSDLLTKESVQHPQEIANQQLLARTSEFVLFEEQDRNLASEYDLAPFFDVKKPAPMPRALENLILASELNLKEAFEASRINDRGRVEDLIPAANETLQRKMSEAWSQSEIQVRLHLNGTQLTILVSSYKGGFEALSERSDGLRQFVALFALLSRRQTSQSRNIYLLIDEAEFRLHYDAQADLVQMLAKQQFAEKVFYTTHSFGCLPEDLGLGIRVIAAAKDNTSTIVNKFWASGVPGFSPVLAGMGATTMAFLPVRFSILTEGAADIILLPSLFREAIDAKSLGFQIAPGLSETGERQLAALRNEGSRVLFLVDGDGGGEGIVSKLNKAGYDNSSRISLRSADGKKKYMTEDFISPSVYAAAINEELHRSGIKLKINEDDLGETERPTRLAEWCAKNKIKVPNKVDIAYRVLDFLSVDPILDEQKRGELLRMHSEIVRRFEPSRS